MLGTIFAPILTVDQHWVIYTHRNTEAVLWVGFCKFADLTTFPDARRNKAWSKLVPFDAAIFTVIEETQISELEANRAAFRLVKKYSPICNLRYRLDGTPNTPNAKPVRLPVECIETGDIFPNSSAVALSLGVTRSMVCSHLKGRRGFETVRGKTFRHIERDMKPRYAPVTSNPLPTMTQAQADAVARGAFAPPPPGL